MCNVRLRKFERVPLDTPWWTAGLSHHIAIEGVQDALVCQPGQGTPNSSIPVSYLLLAAPGLDCPSNVKLYSIYTASVVP